MNPAVTVLFSVAAILFAADLVVLRLILRKRPGHWLLTSAILCLAGALLLLLLWPARKAF